MSDLYSAKSPCRCGFDGTGAHRCHAGRGTSSHCPNAAEPGRFVESRIPYSLPGTQLKMVGDFYHYCAACWAELEGARE